MVEKSTHGVGRFVRDRANRGALVVFAVTTLVFLLVVGNLVVVALDRTQVSPQMHPEIQWSMGRDAGGAGGVGQRLEWGFAVDPGDRRVVDLDVVLPFSVGVDHHDGQALFSSLLTAFVEGQRVGSVSRSVTAMPSDAGESWTHSEDLGEALGRLTLERPADSGAFVLLLVVDWSRTQQDPDSTRFDIAFGPAQVEPAQLAGIPGCTSLDCARVLFVVGVVLQGAGVFWVLNKWQQRGAQGKKGRRGEHAPGAQVTKVRSPGRERTDKEK